MATGSTGVFRRPPPIKRPTRALATMTVPAVAPTPPAAHILAAQVI